MKLFVYGTLMNYSGQMKRFSPESKFITNSVVVGYSIYSLGGFPSLGGLPSLGGFPGIKEVHGSQVYGEIWDVPESDIPRLDAYESEGRLYLRNVVGTYNNEQLQAYVYNHPVRDADRIKSGYWLDR